MISADFRNSHTPTVSVVLPTFNRVRTLRNSVTSVLGQDSGDLELIVVDDGSEDGTIDMLQKINDTRLRILRLPENHGPSIARNRGIETARGDYVAFQDSDDIWVRHKLRTQLAALQDTSNGNFSGVFSAFTIIGDEAGSGKMPVGIPDGYKPGQLYDLLLKYNIVATPTLLVERSLLRKIGGFDGKLEKLEDWDLALRIAAAGYSLAYIPESLLLSRWSSNGVNSRHSPISVYRILEKHSTAQNPVQKMSLAQHYAELVKDFSSLGDRRMAYACAQRGIQLDPRLWYRLKLARYHAWRLLSSLFRRETGPKLR